MKLLDGTGSSTKIRAVYKVMKYAIHEKGFIPDVYSAISGSALLILPLCLGKTEQLDDILDTFDLDTFFSAPPLKENGSLTVGAIKNVICGREYLGKMENLRKVYKSVITEDDFLVYRSSNLPPCYVSYVDFKTGSMTIQNLKQCKSYQELVNSVIASASIPIFSEPVTADGEIKYDGGVRHHSIGAKIMEMLPITEVISVFSRPKDYKSDYEHKNVVSVLLRTIEIMTTQLSKSDEREQIFLSKLKNIKLRQVFMPSVLTSTFDVDKGRLMELDRLALIQAKNVLG